MDGELIRVENTKQQWNRSKNGNTSEVLGLKKYNNKKDVKTKD